MSNDQPSSQSGNQSKGGGAYEVTKVTFFLRRPGGEKNKALTVEGEAAERLVRSIGGVNANLIPQDPSDRLGSHPRTGETAFLPKDLVSGRVASLLGTGDAAGG